MQQNRYGSKVSIPHRYDYDLVEGWSHETAGMFQSHTGTITTPGWKAVQSSQPGFNPTQVRLRRRLWLVTVSRRACFNPTQVRLRRALRQEPESPAHRFNPTQVRLRLFSTKKPLPKGRGFQSHTGTITTRPIPGSAALSPPFQSHTGTITTLVPARLELLHQRFNPTQVRLRLSFASL